MNSLIITMKTPKPYGWFHLLFLGLLLVGVILTMVFIKPNQKKKYFITNVILGVIWGIMLVGEIQKQYIYYTYGNFGTNIVKTFAWNNIPWHFCSTPLYVLPMVIFSSKDSKLRQVGLTYLATFALLGGGLAMFIPTDMFRDRLGNSIQTMVHHMLMILTAIYIFRSGQIGRVKDMFLACYMFLYFVLIAVLLNVAFDEISNHEVEAFYLNPGKRTILPVLNNIQEIGKLPYIDFGYILSLVLYTTLFPLTIFLVWFIGKNFNLITSKTYQFLKFITKAKRGLLINVGLFIGFNILLNLIVYSPAVMKTWDHSRLNPIVGLNKVIGEFIFLSMIVYLVFSITRNTKVRHYSLLGLSFVFNLFNVIQVLLTINHGEALSPSINNNLINHASNLNNFFVKKLFFLFMPTLLIGLVILLSYKTIRRVYPIYSTNFFDIKKVDPTILVTKHKLVQLNHSFVPLIVLGFFMLFGVNQLIGDALVNLNSPTDQQKIKHQINAKGVYGYYLGLPFHSFLRSIRVNYPKDEFMKYNTAKNIYQDIYNNNIIDKKILENSSTTYNELANLFQNKNILTMELGGLSPILPLLKDPRFQRLAPNVMDFINQGYLLNNFYSETGDNPEDSLYTLNHGLNPYNVVKMDQVLNNNLINLLNNKGYRTSLINHYHDSASYYNYAIKNGYKNYHFYNNSNNKNKVDNTNLYNINNNEWFNNLPNYMNDYLYRENDNFYAPRPLSKYYYKDTINPYTSLEYLRYQFGKQFRTSTNNYVNYVMDLPTYPNTYLREEDKGFGIQYKKYPKQNKGIDYIHSEAFNKFPELTHELRKITEEEYFFLQYIGLIDKFFLKLKEVVASFDNTIFMIYSRSNNTKLSHKTVRKLFSTKAQKYVLRNLDYKDKINKQFGLIYAPDNTKDLINNVYPSLIKGENNLVRSLSDFYATITSFLNLENKLFQMGVNLFTNLKKIVINPKDLSIYSDYYRTILGQVNIKNRKFKNFRFLDITTNELDPDLIYNSLKNITNIKKTLDYIYNTKNYTYLEA